MRKIYPSLFNKFAVFILYGLLSVAVITLAQSGDAGSLNNNCPPLAPISPSGQIIIGYVQLAKYTPGLINWDHYDYINVIAYPKGTNPNDAWNNILPPQESELSQLKNLVDEKKGNTKVLLSIRNSDLRDWPDGPDGPDIPKSPRITYGELFNETTRIIKEYNLDGVDIEYPGMRGHYCSGNGSNGLIWDDRKDSGFKGFIQNLNSNFSNIEDKKTLMLTVGKDVIEGLNGNVDLLNIETFHSSFYENYDPLNNKGNGDFMTYPNAPLYSSAPQLLSSYDTAYNDWTGKGKFEKNKIIMGIDLGNTMQIINNESIKNNQIVEAGKVQPDTNLLAAIDFCPDDQPEPLQLYTYPWTQLAIEISVNDTSSKCYYFNNWEHHFDDKTSTSWLVKTLPMNPPVYDYLSYEDFVSLNRKLTYAANNSLKGISISEIGYDSEQYSLVAYMQDIRKPTVSGAVPGGPSTSQGSNPESPSNSGIIPTNTSQNKDNRGKIAGGVIGGVVGVAFIAGAGFLWYRNKQKQQNLYDNKNFNYPHITDQGNPGMVPEGSPRMVPPTTVIPIASGYVTAMFDFEGKEENDLSFKKGDKIEVLERGDGPNDWWVGRVNGTVGEFPGNYVRE